MAGVYIVGKRGIQNNFFWFEFQFLVLFFWWLFFLSLYKLIVWPFFGIWGVFNVLSFRCDRFLDWNTYFVDFFSYDFKFRLLDWRWECLGFSNMYLIWTYCFSWMVSYIKDVCFIHLHALKWHAAFTYIFLVHWFWFLRHHRLLAVFF